jgi:hypothetical protein
MEYNVMKKAAPGRPEVEVLGETFEPGRPEGEDQGRWRQKLASRADRLRYLESAERYWFSKEWFGSEKRKNPA